MVANLCSKCQFIINLCFVADYCTCGQQILLSLPYTVNTVSFRKSSVRVNEAKRRVKLCLSKTGQNDIPVTVTLTPEEIGTAKGTVNKSFIIYLR